MLKPRERSKSTSSRVREDAGAAAVMRRNSRRKDGPSAASAASAALRFHRLLNVVLPLNYYSVPNPRLIARFLSLTFQPAPELPLRSFQLAPPAHFFCLRPLASTSCAFISPKLQVPNTELHTVCSRSCISTSILHRSNGGDPTDWKRPVE